MTDVTADNFGTITAVNTDDTTTAFEFEVDNASTPTVTKTVDENVMEYTVTDPDDNTKTVSAKTFTEGDYFTYKVSVTSPVDINNYTKYEITDTVDSKLDIYDRDYYITCGVDEDDDPVYFTRGTDFTWSVSDDNVITITLTESGIQKITPGSPVEITFRCKINNTAVINTGIKNTATLAWTNKAGREGTSASNPVYVATLGYTMAKVDSEARTALEGAEFEIHTTTDAPIYFTLNNGVYTAQADYTDNTTVKSDANGMIKIEGLAGGTYKLVETKAPSGYQLLAAPLTITVNATSDTAITDLKATSTDAARIVANVKQPDLPITGGMGTLLFTVGGLLLSGGAVFAYVWFKKRRANEEKA